MVKAMASFAASPIPVKSPYMNRFPAVIVCPPLLIVIATPLSGGNDSVFVRVGPALSVTDALAEAQPRQRGAVTLAEFSDGQRVSAFRVIPWEQRTDNSERAPGLGEHTSLVLAEIGVTPEQLERLIASGVVRPPS